MGGHEYQLTDEEAAAMFEPPSWEERYSGEEKVWSGNPNRSWSLRCPGCPRASRSTSAAGKAAT
jgi:hypothetical protein